MEAGISQIQRASQPNPRPAYGPPPLVKSATPSARNCRFADDDQTDGTRRYCQGYIDSSECGGACPSRVASGMVSDPQARKTAEVDVAVFGRGDDDRDVLLAIGEAKWQETMSASHLKRLEHIRDLLAAKSGPGAQHARLLLFSGAGFSDALAQRAATDPAVQLIGLDRLYYGS